MRTLEDVLVYMKKMIKSDNLRARRLSGAKKTKKTKKVRK